MVAIRRRGPQSLPNCAKKTAPERARRAPLGVVLRKRLPANGWTLKRGRRKKRLDGSLMMEIATPAVVIKAMSGRIGDIASFARGR